ALGDGELGFGARDGALTAIEQGQRQRDADEGRSAVLVLREQRAEGDGWDGHPLTTTEREAASGERLVGSSDGDRGVALAGELPEPLGARRERAGSELTLRSRAKVREAEQCGERPRSSLHLGRRCPKLHFERAGLELDTRH